MDAERRRKVKELYHAAAERTPGEQLGFLERVCPAPRLQQETESMFEQSRGILDPSAFSGTEAPPERGEESSNLDSSGAVIPGTVLLQYRVVEKIGRGGMGEVFLAEDTILNRRVALKFLRADVNEIEGHGILSEARSAAAIDHPYVCKIFSTGEAAGKPFIVMEFVDGETLRKHLKAGPVPFRRALSILIEITEALVEAHGKGMIHCDLKPENVMITRAGHVKLMDFGLARRARRVALAPDDATTTSIIHPHAAGTPAYMAPEQARGRWSRYAGGRIRARYPCSSKMLTEKSIHSAGILRRQP